MPSILEARRGAALDCFVFERDTFTFANELIWQYRFDPLTGTMTVCRSDPPPTYSHRCFVVVRSARQFRYHAQFEPELPPATPERYAELIRQVVSRNPRKRGGERIVIPGFAGLREFSAAHVRELKANIGGPLQSYFIRSHWRMVFPVPGWHQRATASQLVRRIHEGAMPLIHVFRFPKVTINHGLLLYEAREQEKRTDFTAYDPNISDEPVMLIYDHASQSFNFPPAIYWSGGRVNVVEIFLGGLY